ncbi:FtsX-like permease family protein, partial [candidate division KSB1 bacterium]|nr:FtsX-like permease family protein [candidate division KSB1 bacterium]NIR68389.1 FtsX-like permease family protein [candidate division KSB1 bacterium]NIS22461.1 FtsX-like permease family protein [candidate division KSB1 bacterium]NIT69311.1 FtsX-like permease family protein [candidate division KSB1 bacterium]NIU22968.1 FtsX-like permease family protein [candidate division KSB1 bacterium]
ATARAGERAREVGVRKVVGAQRRQLIAQFLGESMLTVTFSMLLAIGFSELALPLFNEFAGKSIEINLFSGGGGLLAGFVSLTLILGLLAATYPAFFLSSFKPVKVLKESVAKIDTGTLFLRKGLVTLQFTVSIILIAGTIIVYNQLDYLRSKDIGAETDQVVLIPVQTSAISKNYEAIRTELLRSSDIKAVTTSNRRIGRDINSGTFYSIINDKGQKVSSRLSNIWVGWEFFDLYTINIMHGRGFSRAFPADTTSNAVIMNQEAARVLEINPQQAIGKAISAGQYFRGTIIGVAEDFHFEALYNKIKPMVFILNPGYISYVSVKIASQNVSETMNYIQNEWKQFEPDRIFLSHFLDEDLHQLYVAEERFMKVFTIFTFLAIFTACLGVFGLAKFTASRRTREIGVRKVLGASAADIVKLLSSEVVRLTGVAFLVAVPIAYVVMNRWLQQFAYKTSVSIWIFLLAGFAAALVAWLAVSYQSVKAAMINPARSLRNE